MKVLLVHAYHLAGDPAEARVMKPYPPLGVLYLSAYLKRGGHTVRVFDGTFRAPEELPGEVRAFAPDVVGFYANMMTRARVLALRGALDQVKALFVVGGPDPPHYAEAYLDAGFDAVVVGEGECTMNALLGADPGDWAHIPGLVYRWEGRLVRTPERNPDLALDALPFPDRAAIDLNAYLDCWEKYHGMRPISLITARGCPYRCTWCSHNVYGHSLRRRSAAHVVEEMAHLAAEYRFTHYWFADDVFNIQPKRLHELNDLLREQPDLRRPFECIVRADRMPDDLPAVLVELGCFRCWVGAESGSQRLLDAMKRGVTRDKVTHVVQTLRAHGIQTGMFFMWGFDGETFADVLDTVSLAAGCLPDIALTTVAYPIKGTAFYQHLAEQGRLGDAPDFTSGTDRDVPILGQAPRTVYALADRLLHDRLQAGRLGQGGAGARLKGLAHRVRAQVLQQRLASAFRAHASGG